MASKARMACWASAAEASVWAGGESACTFGTSHGRRGKRACHRVIEATGGLRVFRRRAVTGLPDTRGDAPLALVRQLIAQGVEVAELPVLYRTFSGFTDPKWRMRRGLRNLASLFT